MLKVFLDPVLFERFENYYVRYKNKIYFSEPERSHPQSEAWEVAIFSREFFQDTVDIKALQAQFPFCSLFFLPYTIISPTLYVENVFIYDEEGVVNHNLSLLLENLLQIHDLREQNARNQFLLSPFAQGPIYREFINNLQCLAQSPLPLLILGEKGIQKLAIVEFLFPRLRIEKLDVKEFTKSEFYFFLMGDEFSAGFLGKPHETVFIDNIQELSEENQVFLYSFATKHLINNASSDSHSHYPMIFGGDESIGSIKKVKDLYQTLTIPPIRERKEDLAFLITVILNDLALKYKKDVPPVTVELLLLCQEYPWPENEAQVLRFCEIYFFEGVEKATKFLLSGIQAVDVPQKLPNLQALVESMKEWLESTLIEKAMNFAEGNRKKAAPLLGITYKSLCNKLNSMGIKE